MKLRASAATLLILLPLTAIGCSDDPSPVCQARDDLSSAFDDLKDVNVKDDGIASLQPAIAEVSDRLGDLRSAGAAELEPTIAALETSIEGLRTSVDAATTPAEKIGAFETGIGAIGTDFQQLADELTQCK